MGHFLSRLQHFGDMINEKWTAASITETIDRRLPGLEMKINKILPVCEHTHLLGFSSEMGPIRKLETKIVMKLLNNSE